MTKTKHRNGNGQAVELTAEQLELAVTAKAPEFPIGSIVPADDNVRDTNENLGDLDGLADSILELGIIEPLIVTPHPEQPGKWLLVAGHRRLLAAKRAKLKTVPCLVDDDRSDPTRWAKMLVENLQREKIGHVEQMHGFRALADAGWSQRKIAKTVGRNQSHVSKHLQISVLPDEALLALHREQITMADADKLCDLAEHPAAIVKIVESVKGKDRGFYAASVPTQVEQTLRSIARQAEVDALKTKLEKQGLTVVVGDRVPWDQRLDQIGLKVGAHKSEECHAVFVSSGWSGAEQVPYCTDPRRHTDKGASTLKITKKAAIERAEDHTPRPVGNDAEKAHRKAQRDAARRRLDFMTAVISSGSSVPWITNMVQRRFLTETERLTKDARRVLAQLLDIDSREADDQHTFAEQVLAYAGISKANLERACLALAFVQGENDWRPAVRGEHRDMLATLGYEDVDDDFGPADENAHLDDGPAPVLDLGAIDDADSIVRVCRACGCTDAEACDGGCTWVEDDLCSACLDETGDKEQPRDDEDYFDALREEVRG